MNGRLKLADVLGGRVDLEVNVHPVVGLLRGGIEEVHHGYFVRGEITLEKLIRKVKPELGGAHGVDGVVSRHTVVLYQLADTVTWLRGRHSLKLGVDFHRQQRNFFQVTAPRGWYSFDGQYTQDLTTANGRNGMAKNRNTSANRVLVDLIEAGLQSKAAERERFFALAHRLAQSTDVAERQRLKAELARMTFGE